MWLGDWVGRWWLDGGWYPLNFESQKVKCGIPRQASSSNQ